MFISQLWRYPVKSMAGEALQVAELRADGIVGDRIAVVIDVGGKVVTSRGSPRLLAHRAILGDDGEPLVDGERWDSNAVETRVRAAAGAGARLGRAEGRRRFDMLPLLIATDGAIEAFGYDGRRLRPNIVIGGVEGLAERSWEGRQLRLGPALVRTESLRERCIMTTFDPDTQEQDVDVLLRIHREFGGTLALNTSVVLGATLRVGDPVELEEAG